MYNTCFVLTGTEDYRQQGANSHLRTPHDAPRHCTSTSLSEGAHGFKQASEFPRRHSLPKRARRPGGLWPIESK